MGNTQIKSHPRVRNKKQVHWKAADRPAPTGKPELLPESEGTPDLVTLRWSRPINDGGSPISGYLVEHRRVGSPHWVRATPVPVPFPEITLSGLEPGWRYQFRVSAENAVGYSDPSEISEQITVTFQRSAITAPKFTQEVNDTVALENNKCEFVVHFLGQPAPKVCWFKDGFEIFSSRRIRILTEYDRSVLTIHQTSLSDEGEIKCTATNRAGHVSSKARLTVEAPPSIRLPRNYEEGLLFEIGEVIRFKVSVVGRPTPLVFWAHNGESIQDNDRYDIQYTDKSCSLKIDEGQRCDRGEYQIKAVNKLGEDSASFLVTVTDKPSPPGKARVVMALGKSVTLSWSPPRDDGGCKIGNYIVEYYRLGWNVWLKAATSRQLTTLLGDLIEGSEYKFRVKAESPYGVSEPSEESEVIFVPDPKRGITHPSPRNPAQQKDFFVEPSKPNVSKRQKKSRSQSSSRVELQPKTLDYNTSVTVTDMPPIPPKRTKSKSQQHTPETTPLFHRKVLDSQVNKNIFDRASLSRDLAYGSPDLKIRRGRESPQKENIISSNRHARLDPSKTPSPESKVVHTVYKVKIETPKEEPKTVLPEPKKVPSPEERRKPIREHNENVSGSSEFMLVLYSDENEQDHSDMFNFDENSIPPPLSLSAPELSGLESAVFPPLKHSASSSELLYDRALIRFYQAAKEEEKELEKKRLANYEKHIGLDIPKIQINSKEGEDIVGLDRKHLLRRKMSAGLQKTKLAQKRHSLKDPSELKNDILSSNLKKSPISIDIKRDSNMSTTNGFPLTELKDKKFKTNLTKSKGYTQDSFEKKPVSFTEEEKWNQEYEESMSESETDSESDYERFKYEVSRSKKVHLNKNFNNEADTYRPPEGLGSMRRNSNEPFEILSKRKKLPDPNFIPKPILKKTDSPSTSPNVSPIVSPPSSPTKSTRALSPRPDIILKRNRSKSLAVPALPPLISTSSGDESDEPKKPRNRSVSLTIAQNLLPHRKEISKQTNKNTTVTMPSIATVAQITGITAASIVIPQKLLDKKRDEEAVRVVADHYDDIVRSIGYRRKSNPQIYMDRDSLKRAADDLGTPQEDELSSKEQTPSKENLSQDSGYQSVSSYRRSFSEHYDLHPPDKPSPIRTTPAEVKTDILENKIEEHFLQGIQKESLTANTYTGVGNLKNRSDRGFSQQTKNKNPTRTIDAAQASTRRGSLTDTKTNHFAHRVDQTAQSIGYQTHQGRKTTSASKSRRSVGRSTSPSKRGTSITRVPIELSPSRLENRKVSTLSGNQEIFKKTPLSPIKQLRKSKSPSPNLSTKRRPMLKEIMTQTSGNSESLSMDFDMYPRYLIPNFDKDRQEELLARAEVKVRTAVDWLTDLAMFAVACWIYLFKNELLAVPILLVMVYRQLKEEIRKRTPEWVARRFKRKPRE